MSRAIIDLPRFLLRASLVDWDIDWRGQSAGGDTAGGEQVVYNAFPRWVGSPRIILPGPMIGVWRAIRAQAEGRVNAYRVPMVDPVSLRPQARDWRADLQAWQRGIYRPHRPVVTCTTAVAAGATTITVNEALAGQPVRVGAFLSYDDWPFVVTGRAGAGAAVTLSVKMLRTAIPAGAAIDLAASGVFLGTSDTMGNPAYDTSGVASVDLDFREWIGR
ncbi:hypothetical protein KM176_24465 [Pseudooceanicola sp. CBS1P-1]|uniref:Uncharacterized protein n=1 Tax=Pseudooceanicola albus TaxID=2692189 RepID=A0A6L7GBQ7_9RHOB|nr:MULTISPECIES: hypothetical protein [Pseudooceanicola]MBT9387017.1 hypothetical protein [Pseudooceanicola endophyticus]MXN21142.1 hypothetical protein [Pseudooceanicola albus]